MRAMILFNGIVTGLPIAFAFKAASTPSRSRQSVISLLATCHQRPGQNVHQSTCHSRLAP